MTRQQPRPLTPWRGVLAFGFVSLAADMVYEGMRSVSGPFLASLGASALTVGLVTGAGEAMALVLRLVAGPWADRTQRHWALTILGYVMTAVCVPLLAVAPHIGAPGLALATLLILLERTGKAVRSPSKSVLLAAAATSMGRGKGFGVHKALDQVGALSGPLLVAAVTGVTGVVWPSFAVLAVPGAASIVLLLLLRRRLRTDLPGTSPRPATPAQASGVPKRMGARDLPTSFYAFATAVAANTAGLMTFGVFGFHLVDAGLVDAAVVPVVYAGAMAIAAGAALVSGWVYDRQSHGVLLVLPVLVAAVPSLALADSLSWVLAGLLLWGAATGVQDSTVKALVADLVPTANRGTGYGVFAAFQGVAALFGGAMAGSLYRDHLAVLSVGTVLLQAVSYVPLMRAIGAARKAATGPAEDGPP